MRQTHVISLYLNSVCYLISYTRLFTRLNFFEILLYVILTTKFSRSTEYCKYVHMYGSDQNKVMMMVIIDLEKSVDRKSL